MTLEEAIQSMKESFKSAPNEYEKSVQDGFQLLALLDSNRDPEMCKKIDRLEEENMRLLDYTVCRFPNRRKEYEMENKSDNSKSGIGFAGALQIAFIVLKLCRVIDWPWIWVLSPIWVTIALVIIGFVIITAVIKRRRNK